jgi:hypothetical protein
MSEEFSDNNSSFTALEEDLTRTCVTAPPIIENKTGNTCHQIGGYPSDALVLDRDSVIG